MRQQWMLRRSMLVYYLYLANFSAALEASAFRSELIVMKLDDKWRKGFKTYFYPLET